MQYQSSSDGAQQPQRDVVLERRALESARTAPVGHGLGVQDPPCARLDPVGPIRTRRQFEFDGARRPASRIEGVGDAGLAQDPRDNPRRLPDNLGIGAQRDEVETPDELAQHAELAAERRAAAPRSVQRGVGPVFSAGGERVGQS